MNLHRPCRVIMGCSRLVLAAAIAALSMAVPAGAQSDTWREVDNPYQEDLDYRVGATLNPGIEIDGVRWRSLVLEADGNEVVAAGEDADLKVTVSFENRNPSSVKLLVILLLEDGNGAPLERVELGTFKVGGQRLKERIDSATVTGDVLLATRKVYLFCEVLP
ncbi:MAG TPA: hypothetical protein VLT32_20985 [Candidatus Sulfomarinibacteraceae bacterium]|nr:hypothetical protein [Candidatus Sulfomarinibacteraceae bacterium]